MEITDVNNTLVREILSIWAEVNFEGSVKSQNQFLEQPLWYNSLIKVGNKPIFYKKLFLKGISKVKHIMRDCNKFFSLAEVSNIYNIQIQPLTFFGLVSSVRSIRTPVRKEVAKSGLKNNSNYTFCGDFPEELCHLFWHCKKSSCFWDDLLL